MQIKDTNIIDSLSYLPEPFQDNEYFKKLCSCIDLLLYPNSPEYAYDPEQGGEEFNSKYFTWEVNELNTAINKYRDYRSLDAECIHQMVSEFGYDYIIDILDLPDSALKNLIAYLALINMLKGSRQGLELVLSLLGFDFKLVEWWEDRQLLEERCTYALELYFINMGMVADFFYRFDRFSRQYVYPLLAMIIVRFKFDYGRMFIGAGVGLHPNVKIYPPD